MVYHITNVDNLILGDTDSGHNSKVFKFCPRVHVDLTVPNKTLFACIIYRPELVRELENVAYSDEIYIKCSFPQIYSPDVAFLT